MWDPIAATRRTQFKVAFPLRAWPVYSRALIAGKPCSCFIPLAVVPSVRPRRTS